MWRKPLQSSESSCHGQAFMRTRLIWTIQIALAVAKCDWKRYCFGSTRPNKPWIRKRAFTFGLRCARRAPQNITLSIQNIAERRAERGGTGIQAHSHQFRRILLCVAADSNAKGLREVQRPWLVRALHLDGGRAPVTMTQTGSTGPATTRKI